MNNKKYIRTTISGLLRELQQEAKVIAAYMGISQGKLFTEAITEYIEKNRSAIRR